MKEYASRRRRRIDTTKKASILLGTSSLVFLVGLTSLSWAIGSAAATKAQDEKDSASISRPTEEQEQSSTQVSRTQGEPDSAEEGADRNEMQGPMLLAQTSEGETLEEASSEEGQGQSEQTDNAGDAGAGDIDAGNAGANAGTGNAGAGTEDIQLAEGGEVTSQESSQDAQESQGWSTSTSAAGNRASSGSQGDSTGSGSGSGSGASKRYKTITHTATKKEAVYKTVWHEAAVRNNNPNGEVTWILCSTCGQRHSQSYSQQVIDSYKYTYCSACGKAHDRGYTEMVEY